MNASDRSSLYTPLASLSLSASFKKAAAENGYHSLEDILAIPLTELVEKEWFTAAMFEELTVMVKHNIFK